MKLSAKQQATLDEIRADAESGFYPLNIPPKDKYHAGTIAALIDKGLIQQVSHPNYLHGGVTIA